MKSKCISVQTAHCYILRSTKRDPWKCKLDQGQYGEVFGNEVTTYTVKMIVLTLFVNDERTIRDVWLKYVIGKFKHERRIFKWFDDAGK